MVWRRSVKRGLIVGVVLCSCVFLLLLNFAPTNEPSGPEGEFEVQGAEEPAPIDYVVADSDVKDPQGSTVHTATDFTSALQWAVSSPGKVVSVPSGQYSLNDSIAPADDVTLLGEGDGEDGTVFDFTSETPSHARIQISNGVDGVKLAKFRITGNANIEMRVDGGTSEGHTVQEVTAYRTSSIQQAAFDMIVLNKGTLEGVQFIRCRAIETEHIGFMCEGDGYRAPGGVKNTPTYSGWIKDLYLEDCLADHCGYYDQYNAWVVGFDLAESVNVENVRALRCTAQYCWESGFHFEPSPAVKNAVLQDCVASFNGQKPDDYRNGDGTHGLWFGKGYYWAPGRTTVTLVDCTGEGNAKGLSPLTGWVKT